VKDTTPYQNGKDHPNCVGIESFRVCEVAWNYIELGLVTGYEMACPSCRQILKEEECVQCEVGWHVCPDCYPSRCALHISEPENTEAVAGCMRMVIE